MEDEVKITVIATGFHRENLPKIARAAAASASASSSPEILEPPAERPAPGPPELSSFPFVTDEPEPMTEPAAEFEPEPEVLAAPEPQAPVTEPAMDDLDVPAYLRRNRRR
jgi:hypothetical protein